jgi:spermidine synthase
MTTNAPYLLIPIIACLLILYGFSLLFARLGILSRNMHRKAWNYTLLLTFLVTIVLGILMAVQVNYKLEVPWTEKVLRWHVNFGIGMSLTGLFHFTWHWLYFLPFVKQKSRLKEKQTIECEPIVSGTPGHFRLFEYPFAIGFSGVLVQTILIRELLSLFQGNELTLSIILLLWLVITGAGSIAGSVARTIGNSRPESAPGRVVPIVRALVILPLVLIPLLYLLKKQFFAPGMEAGPLPFSALLLLILLPYCFLSGFSFTWSARVLQPDGSRLRHLYGWESAGGAAGGLLATLTILAGLPSLTVLFLSASLLILLVTVRSRIHRMGGLVTALVLLMIGMLVQFTGLDQSITRLFHPNEAIVLTRPGTSGRITVTETGGQTNIYENGLLVHSAGHIIVNEELASFTLTQKTDPGNVLVIGGLLTGIEGEIRKFTRGRIDFVETDPHLLKQAVRLGLAPSGDGIRLIRKTPALWVKRADLVYDAIIINLPGPHNLQLNRFYSTEFFSHLKPALATDGIVTAVLPGTANYVSEEAASVLGPVRQAGLESFRHALVLPGENSYLLLSDSRPGVEILDRIEELGIDNLYVNRGYFDERLFRARTELVNQEISGPTRPNSVLHPVASLSQIAWWLGHFPRRALLPVLILTALVILAGFWSGHAGLTGIFILGAAASGSEILLLFLLQSVAGALYQLSGLFLGIFMAGLAAGSLFYHKMPGQGDRARINLALLLFLLSSASLLLLLPWLSGHNGSAFGPILLLLVTGFTLAAATGIFFAGLTHEMRSLSIKQNRLYGYDLLGAGAGAIIFPLVIIPLAGMLFSAFIITLSCLAVWLILMITARIKRA